MNLPKTFHQARRAYIFRYLASALIITSAIILRNYAYSYIPALAGVLFLIYLEIHIRLNRLEIDKTKVTINTGLLSIHSTTVYYNELTDMKVTQNIWQRLIKYGSISINTPGHQTYEIHADKLPNPHTIRTLIETLKHEKSYIPKHNNK